MTFIGKNITKPKDDSKQQIAYNAIKAAIIKNELLPDTLLVERQLCSNLGISRTPVREALRRLASEGLVDFIPDKGMFVSKIRLEDMIEIFELREALEGMAVRLCVLRKDAALLQKMKECLDLQEAAYKEGKYSLNIEKDLEFHQLYIKGARNTRLESFLNTILDQNSRMAFYTVTDKERIANSLVQHRKVLAAIEQGDAEQAEMLIKEHIVNIKEYHLDRYFALK